MDGSERGPSKRRAEVRWVPRIDVHAAAFEKHLDHPHIAHPAGGVERRAAVDAGRCLVETQTEHEFGDPIVAVENCLRQVPVDGARQRRQE
jgi:hypothetical protein